MNIASHKNTLAPSGRGEDPLTSVSGRVRGSHRSLQFRQNCGKNTIHIADDVIVPKAKSSIALTRKECVTPQIISRPVRMLSAIRLNNQTKLNTKKIGNVRTHRHLSTELRIAQLPISQARPKQRLRMGLVSPQRTSTCRVFSFHTPSPHPSPLWGEGVHRQNNEDNRS